MTLVERIRRDFARHPVRGLMLGVLSVLLVGLSARAILQMQPRTVIAAPAVTSADLTPDDAAEAQQRIDTSARLWRILREKSPSAIPVSLAFTFDASQYQPDPSVQPVIAVATLPPPALVLSPVDAEGSKAARVREQARSLVVRSTAVGNEVTRPVAIVNQQLLTVGQEIMGFLITAIRAREVEFEKDGVTIAVKMPDEPRGQ